MRNSRPGLNAEPAPYGKSVVSHVTATTTVTPKLTATDPFTTLDNFVTIMGTPSISAGKLVGEGVVRYKNQALTDHHKASAVIGTITTGTTRLAICGDVNLTRYYALEVKKTFGSASFSIVKGTASSSVQEGNDLITLLFNLLLFVFSLFSQNTTKFATTTVSLAVSDEVAVEYDPETSTLKTYKNDVATACTLQVPRGEIGHGPGYRWAGVAQGVDGTDEGVLFTAFTLEDV